MGPQRSRWRCPKRDGPGQIEELAVEIGFRFVNRMSHLATQDLSPGTTAIQRDSKCQGSKTSGTWNSTLRLFVPLSFDAQGTMATIYLSGDAKNI